MAVVSALLTSAVLPPIVRAQVVEIAPAYGMYFPIGEWQQQSDGGTGFAPIRRQLPAHMLAARFTAWPSERFGVEGTAAFAPSQVAMSVDGNTRDIHGGVALASARALYKLATLVDGKHELRRESWDVIVGAGGGVVHRGGSAWDSTKGVTRPAFVLTAALHMPFTKSLTWRVGLEDFITWTQFDAGLATQTRARTHHDLVASLSVVIRLRDRPVAVSEGEQP